MSALPTATPEIHQRDEDQLKLLAVFHFVLAGLSLIGLAFIAFHFALMRFFIGNPAIWTKGAGSPPPATLLTVLNVFYAIGGTLVAAAGTVNLVSGLSIRQRTRRTFSLVVAGLNCVQFPLGTVLGVFTFVVLLRDSVRDTYARQLEPDPRIFSED